MEDLNFITSSYFWQNVYLISKWIFIFLSFILTIGIIWLIIKISNFRQKLNIQDASQEYKKNNASQINPLKNIAEKESVLVNSNIKESISNSDKTSELSKSKWGEIMIKTESESEEDWKMSIIKADALFDTMLKRRGLSGETIKERLKAISQENVLDLDNIWEAHRARNEIAHNTMFSLSKKDALKFLKIYKKALEDLKVM